MDKQIATRKETPKRDACQKIVCRSPLYRPSTLMANRYNVYHGFTLVELLVVMTIISLLAAMLMPVLARAIEMSRVAVCANNEKQFAVNISQFADDHNGFLPCGGFARKLPPYQSELFPEWQPGTTIINPIINENWSERVLPDNLIWPYWSPLQKAMCPSHPSRNSFLDIIKRRLMGWID